MVQVRWSKERQPEKEASHSKCSGGDNKEDLKWVHAELQLDDGGAGGDGVEMKLQVVERLLCVTLDPYQVVHA